MSYLKDIIDKQRLKKCLELLKSHVATSVNGNKPDSNGAVNVDVGVKTIDSITPDEEGNVKIPVATDEEVEAGEVDNKYMTPANTLFAINKRTANFYNSVSDMKSDKKLKAGMTACTLGYYEPNDGGAGTYIIRAKQDGDVDDGGSLHELKNNCVAELVVENGTVNVKQFGAKGDGVSDDTEAIQRAVNSNNKVYIPKATYIYSDILTIKNDTYGEGNESILYNSQNPDKAAIRIESNVNIKNFKIKITSTKRGSIGTDMSALVILKNKENITINGIECEGGNGTGLFCYGGKNIYISECFVHDTLADGIHITNSSENITVENCHVVDTGDDGIAFISYKGDSDGRVKNCKAINNTIKATAARGITNGGSKDIIIIGNHISNCAAAGILVHGTQGGWTFFTAQNTTIMSNICENNLMNFKDATTFVSALGEISITEMIPTDTEHNENTLIKGNTVTTHYNALELYKTSDVTIVDNIFNGGIGFHITHGGNPRIRCVFIKNNIFNLDKILNISAVIEGCDEAIISNNIFYIKDDETHTISYNNIDGGEFSGNRLIKNGSNSYFLLQNCKNYMLGYNYPQPITYEPSSGNSDDENGEFNVVSIGGRYGITLSSHSILNHNPAVGTLCLDPSMKKLKIKVAATSDSVTWKYITLSDN